MEHLTDEEYVRLLLEGLDGPEPTVAAAEPTAQSTAQPTTVHPTVESNAIVEPTATESSPVEISAPQHTFAAKVAAKVAAANATANAAAEAAAEADAEAEVAQAAVAAAVAKAAATAAAVAAATEAAAAKAEATEAATVEPDEIDVYDLEGVNVYSDDEEDRQQQRTMAHYAQIPNPPTNREYASFAVAEKELISFSRRHGFEVAKYGATKKDAATGVLLSRAFRCAKGVTNARSMKYHADREAAGIPQQRRKPSKKTGCPFSVALRAIDRNNPEGLWTLSLS